MTPTIITGAHPLALGIARGLVDRGDDVRIIAPLADLDRAHDTAGQEWVASYGEACTFATEEDVAAAIARAVATLGGLRRVVHAWLAPRVLDEVDFASLAEADWVAGCEASFDGAWWVMRHVRAAIVDSGGGSVVTIVPSIGVSGGAGFAPLAAVAEGLRVLAKGCGRQWAQHGVTANTIVAAPHHWVDHEAGERLRRAVTLSVPAFGGEGGASADLAPLVAAVTGPDTHFLTAGTLMADGGTWMGL